MDEIRCTLWLLALLTVCCSNGTATCGTDMRTNKSVYKIGENIHITCSTKSSLITVPSKFYIMHTTNQNPAGQNVSAVFHVSGSNVKTDIKVRSKSDAGTYICYYGNCTTALITSFSVIRVIDSVSFRAPTLSCITENHWNMTCTWNAIDNKSVILWKMLYKRKEADTFKCCVSPIRPCDKFTIDTACFISDSDFAWHSVYQLMANFGDNITKEFHYTISANDSMLRCLIGGGMILSATAVRQCDITTKMDCVPSTVGGVVCHVKAVSQRAPHDVVRRNFTSNSDDFSLHGTINHLEPFTSYNVSLTCRPSVSPYWSNTLYGVVTTLSEPPVLSPEVTGYSEMTKGDNGRDVVLYISPIARFYGRKPTYVVRFDSGGTLVMHVFPGNVTTAVIASLNCTQTYTLRIISRNEAGSSRTSTVLDIPESQPRHQVVVVDRIDEGHVQIILFGHEAPGYAQKTCYFTCVANDGSVPPICKTKVKSVCIDGVHMSHLLPVTLVNMEHNAYGLSLQNSSRIGGIMWSACIFQPSRKQSSEKLIVVGRWTNDTALELTLNFDYCLLPKRPLVYQIESAANKNCTFEDAANVTATPWLKSIPVEINGGKRGLVICFRVIYADNSFVTVDDMTTALGAPSDETSNDSDGIPIAAGISAGLAVCLLVISFIWLERYRRHVKSRNLVQDIIEDLDFSAQSEAPTGHFRRVNDPNSPSSEQAVYPTSDQWQKMERNAITRASGVLGESTDAEVLPGYEKFEIAGDPEKRNFINYRKTIGKDVNDNKRNETKYFAKDNEDSGISSENCVHKERSLNDLTEIQKHLQLENGNSDNRAYDETVKLKPSVVKLELDFLQISNIHDQESGDYATLSGAVSDPNYTGVNDSGSNDSSSSYTWNGDEFQIDSYTVVFNDSRIDSGQSLSDYVLSSEITS